MRASALLFYTPPRRTMSVEPEKTQPSPRVTPTRVVIAALLLLAATIIFLLCPSQPTMIQSLPNGIVPHKPSLIHRWVPPTWGWFWRLKESVFGRSKVISLDAKVFDCRGLSSPVTSALLLKRPQFQDANGLQVWVMPDSELSALQHSLEQ